uniref:PH domain-containing protein n=1 Tax=Setaria digitata TaxID=48799 RepID=A0A915PDZ1_9BILA
MIKMQIRILKIHQTVKSISDVESKRTTSALLNESSDSGAITLSDEDSKSLRPRIGERNHLPCGMVSSENPVRQSVLETYSKQIDWHLFMQRTVNPKCFDVLKDIVMLERTAVFDLKILTQDFYQIVPEEALSCGRALVDLFVNLNSLQGFHHHHLNTLEIILNNWYNIFLGPAIMTGYESFKEIETLTNLHFKENRLQSTTAERPRIGDLLLCSVHNALQYYRKFVSNSPIYLAAVDELTHANNTFADSLYNLQMMNFYCCSINFLILKVIHRMVVWQNLLGRMVAALLEENNEAEIASQLNSCRVAVEKVASFNAEKKSTFEGLVHFTKFVELGNDLNIVDGLIDPNRVMLAFSSKPNAPKILCTVHNPRWLCKWTQRGFKPHIVILFSDSLLFAYRSQADGFIRNAFLPLRAMTVEEGDVLHVVTDPTICLTIRAFNLIFLLSSDCTRVRDLWLDELKKAIQNAKHSKIENLPLLESFVIMEDSFNDKSMQSCGMPDAMAGLGAKVLTTASCSTLDICWHRHATLGINAVIAAPANQMSGYLLSKFRNSAEWQKFWVVHANFALTFFRSHQEPEPIAVLPIISYHISLPQLNDKIDCDNVFKVSYNTHCYFFRTDSLYAFSKWYECIRESTINSSPLNLIAGFPLK